MQLTPPEVLAAALQLSVESRARLAEQLLESLSEEFESGDENAFADELDRRFADYQRHPETSVSWEDLKNQSE